MLSAEQREEFDRLGVLRLPGAIAARDAETMCDLVWDALARRHQVRRDAPESWPALRASGAQYARKSVTFEQAARPALCGALDGLMGNDNWQRPERWNQLLAAFPDSREPWDVPIYRRSVAQGDMAELTRSSGWDTGGSARPA